MASMAMTPNTDHPAMDRKAFLDHYGEFVDRNLNKEQLEKLLEKAGLDADGKMVTKDVLAARLQIYKLGYPDNLDDIKSISGYFKGSHTKGMLVKECEDYKISKDGTIPELQ